MSEEIKENQERESKENQEIKSKTGDGKKKGKKFVKEFLQFIQRGNVIDLAVGIVVGGAFQKIVSSLVKDIIMPLLSLLGGRNLSDAKVIMRPAIYAPDGGIIKEEIALFWGSFVQAVIDFLIIAFAIFIAIKAMAAFRETLDKRAKTLAEKLKIINEDENNEEQS